MGAAGRSETNQPREGKSARTRAAILRAARELFGKRDYRGIKVGELAEKAEVSVPTLYVRFPGGKEAIAGALFGELYLPLQERAFAAAGDPLEDLKQFGQELAALAHENWDYTAALLEAVQGATIAQARDADRQHLPLEANDPRRLAPLPIPIAHLIRRCQKHKPPQIRTDTTAEELAKVYANLMMLRVLTRKEDEGPEIAQFINTVLLDGLRPRSARQQLN